MPSTLRQWLRLGGVVLLIAGLAAFSLPSWMPMAQHVAWAIAGAAMILLAPVLVWMGREPSPPDEDDDHQ